MALPTAQPEARPGFGLTWRRVIEWFEGYPIERIGMAMIAAGIVLRFAAPFLMDFRSDGDTYVAMGHAWALRHEFLMPYGDVTTWGPTPPGYSNHYPPLYPLYLGLVFSAFGFGLWQAKWAAVAISIAALGVVYLATRDLYGRVSAALVTGILAIEPQLLWVTGAGFSENLVLLLFAVTMWAILRSLKDDRYIVIAGLFAALAYLSRASVGYFFVIAGVGGLAWRIYYRRWKVFTNVWYMGAILLFGAVVAAWAIRNVVLFGWVAESITLFGTTWDFQMPLWETSSYTRYVQNYAIERPDKWRHALIAKIPLFLAFLAWYALPFLPESWKATKRIREEDTSALWLSIALLWIIGWIIAAMFWVFEGGPMYWLIHHRYVVIGILPLAWLIVREARVERASFRLRYVLVAVSLFAACGATIMSPVKFSDLRAAEHMDQYLVAGDEIGIDGGTIKYAFYAYLTHPESVQVYGVGTDGYSPEFIVTLKTDGDYGPEYTRVGEWRQTFWNGGVMPAYLLARNDVIAERDIVTGVLVSS